MLLLRTNWRGVFQINLAFILALGIFFFTLTYIAFALDKSHMALKFIMLGLVLFSFPVMTRGLLQDCNYVLDSTIETYSYNGSDLSTVEKSYIYDYQCVAVDQDNEVSSYVKITAFASRLFVTYIFIYFVYMVFLYVKKMRDGSG